jgi:uncharacterized protein YukE
MNLKETLVRHRNELQTCCDARANYQQIYAIMEQQEEELNEILATLIAIQILNKNNVTYRS